MSDAGPRVVIVGAGLAGLCCALRLAGRGVPATVLDAAAAVGGRVQTDAVDGFLLDRGFQVFLTAYPEARRVLDYPALDLRPFAAGAIVRAGGRWHRLFDPLRHPATAGRSALSPLLTVADKLRAVRLWAGVRPGDPQRLLDTGPDRTTADELAARRFSDRAVAQFFRPFFGGVFLQRDLTTSARFFRYTFRMFAAGRAAVPAGGMGRIPEQLAARARAAGAVVRCGARAVAIEPGGVRLASGEVVPAQAVVVATELPAAERLLGPALQPASGHGAARSACTLYFAADRPAVGEPALVLNGDGPAGGPVNHLAEMTAAAPGYGPPGQALVSASVVDAGAAAADDATLIAAVRAQLAGWFGPTALGWRHLRTYRIDHALPPQDPPTLDSPERPVLLTPGSPGGPRLYVCGDHRDQASIQGAMVSGRRAADAVAEDLAAGRDPDGLTPVPGSQLPG